MNLILKNYLHELRVNTAHHGGYPYNLKYNYEELLPFLNFTINNLGDPFIDSNYAIHSKQFEREGLKFFAELYKADNWWGYVTSCGTEGNLYGILLGRECYKNGILYFSQDTHYSVIKAARLFRIEYKIIASKNNGEIDYSELIKKLDSNRPAIMNLNIGTTFTGAIDNLEKIQMCLAAKNITDYYIHCDGALGGMIMAYEKPDLVNFQKNIHSLSISGHKFIGSPFPYGIVITRKELMRHLENEIEYIGSKDTTLGGSRNGHAAIYLWYAIQARKQHFSREIKQCLANAEFLSELIKKEAIYCLLNKYSSTVVFEKPSDKLVRKWQLATQGERAHFVVMQNHNQEILGKFVDELVNDLRKSVNNPKAMIYE